MDAGRTFFVLKVLSYLKLISYQEHLRNDDEGRILLECFCRQIVGNYRVTREIICVVDI